MAWFGIGETYLRALDRTENIQLWNALLDKITKWNFNTVRLAFIFSDVTDTNSSSSPPLDMQKLNDVLDLLNQRGYKAILDLHNYNDMIGYFGSPQWKQNWLTLVPLIKNHPAVAAYELFNEPFQNYWDPINVKTSDEAWRAYATLTLAIRQIDSTHPIIWLGILSGWNTPPQDVIDVAHNSNIIFTFHPWSWKVGTQYSMTLADADAQLKYLLTTGSKSMKTIKDAGFNIWNGEFGVHFHTGAPNLPPVDRYLIEKYYNVKLINACMVNGAGFCWWLYTKNHWKTGSADDVIGSSNYNGALLERTAENFGRKHDDNLNPPWNTLACDFNLDEQINMKDVAYAARLQ